MPKWLKIVIAAVACAIILIGYSVLSAILGLKHGGGYLILFLLFTLLGGLWRTIVNTSNEKNPEIKEGERIGKTEPQNESEISPSHNEITQGNVVSERIDNEGKASRPIASSEEVTGFDADFHIAVKVLLVILMFFEIVVMVHQAVNDFTWENYTIGWVRLISSLIGLVGFVLLYEKKLAGFIIIVSVLLFCVVYSAIMHDPNLAKIIYAVLIRLVSLSLFLLIRKDDVSAWSILLRKHTKLINELRRTFPVKPFIYIENQADVRQKEHGDSASNFDKWLNS